MVHGASVEAPAERVRADEAVDHAVACAVGVEAVEGARGSGLGIVHAPGPEPAAAVGLPVVEAVLRPVQFGPGDRPDGPGVEVEEVEAGAQGHHQAARRAPGEGADGLGHRPLRVTAGGGIEPVHDAALDVDPVEEAVLRVPERRLAEERPRRQDAADLGHDPWDGRSLGSPDERRSCRVT